MPILFLRHSGRRHPGLVTQGTSRARQCIEIVEERCREGYGLVGTHFGAYVMTRKDLIHFLEGNPKTVRQLAMETRQTPADVENDLIHILQSLKHQSLRLEVRPATCRKCGFVFSEDRFRKPSKCPECRGTWLTEPQVLTTPHS